jgi:hypothetical protein
VIREDAEDVNSDEDDDEEDEEDDWLDEELDVDILPLLLDDSDEDEDIDAERCVGCLRLSGADDGLMQTFLALPTTLFDDNCVKRSVIYFKKIRYLT